MRRIDRYELWFLSSVLGIAMFGPVKDAFAQTQSQDYINGTTAVTIMDLTHRIDRMENLVMAALITTVGTLLVKIFEILTQREKRR